MAIDFRSELSRPFPLALAILAAGLALWILVSTVLHAGDRRDHARQVEVLQAGQTTLSSELDLQKRTAGTLKDLQVKIALLDKRAQEASRADERALLRSEALRQEQEAAQLKTAEAETGAQTQIARLTELQGQVEAAEQKLAPLREATSAAEQSAKARTQDLADVGRRLEEVRQQEAKLRGDLAAMAQEATGKTSELAQAEQNQQKAREAAAAAQKDLADARFATDSATKQHADLEQTVAALSTNRESLVSDIALRVEQLRQVREALASAQTEAATAQADRDRATSERNQAEQTTALLKDERETQAAGLESLAKRQAEAQAQLATLTETLASRNKDLATLEERLTDTRQQLAAAQATLADRQQQLSGQPAIGGADPGQGDTIRPR